MKTCVVTASFACDPSKLWLYLTKPTLNGWRKDVRDYEEKDGSNIIQTAPPRNCILPGGKSRAV